jgi:hypothetical protein
MQLQKRLRVVQAHLTKDNFVERSHKYRRNQKIMSVTDSVHVTTDADEIPNYIATTDILMAMSILCFA